MPLLSSKGIGKNSGHGDPEPRALGTCFAEFYNSKDENESTMAGCSDAL